MKNTYVFSIGAALLAATVLPATLTAAPIPAKPHTNVYVSDEAQQTVARLYPDAKDLTWGSDGDVYTAYFREPFSKVVANVDGEGNLLDVLTYYDQGQMPMRIRALLKEKFPNQKVKFVTRNEQEGSDYSDVPDVSYQATLEDATHWYVVTISGDQITNKKVLLKA